jgi:citrate lyase gamma subunit
MKRLNRRDFLRGAAGVTLVGASGTFCQKKASRAKAPEKKKAAVEKRARVILVRDEKVIDSNRKVNPEIIARMLDDGVKALLEEEKAEAAWARLIRPDDVVGIKSNVWSYLPTPPELEEAIRRRVMGAGVPQEKIDIDDRGVLDSVVFAAATALINVRPMRTHNWSGVGSCLKNYIMFHPQPSRWHGDSCADLAGLWKLPIVAGKTRLNILVMLTPLFHGKGPHHYQAEYTWEYRGLIVGIDPVAVDSTGLRILEAQRKRHFKKDIPFTASAKHIQVAAEKHKLGVADPARIDLIKLGWTEGALI